MNRLGKLWATYTNWRPFTEPEAWTLFRLAAFAEAIGWTLLIFGVLFRNNIAVSWNEVPVQLAGRIHGTLFLLYIVAVLVLSPSLKWSWFRILIAGACSVPPYGSLIYEQWSAGHRKFTQFNKVAVTTAYKLIVNKI